MAADKVAETEAAAGGDLRTERQRRAERTRESAVLQQGEEVSVT